MGVLLVLVPRGGLVVHAGAAVIVVALVWMVRRAARIGVEVDEGGLVVYGPARSQRVSWAGVAGFGTHRWGTSEVVDVRLVDGRVLNANLIQGARADWENGKTDDILSVLRRELDTHSTQGRR